jgi:hypothetical protein
MKLNMTTVYDVCVIGAGPAGISAALELANLGLLVALIESGSENTPASIQSLSNAQIQTPNAHSPMHEAVHRGLGGTSAIWGGRCVPLDEVDFYLRDYVPHASWPISHTELTPYYPRACEFLQVGKPHFSVDSCKNLASKDQALSEKFVESDTLSGKHLERWSQIPNMWSVHKNSIKNHPRIRIFTDLTCIGFCQAQANQAVTAISLKQSLLKNSLLKTLQAKAFVLACGGVESTRLILNSLRDPQGLKLPNPDLVGRYYMGHPSGKIADIVLNGDPKATLYGFELDGNTYIRRRITIKPKILQKEQLLNIAFWFDNPPIADWQHKSGVLSAAYLALTTPILGNVLAPTAIRQRIAGEKPPQRLPHLNNCLSAPLATGRFCVKFLRQRYLSKPRLPGFFTYSGNNRYALHYHAEQAPNWYSRISLANETDAHGLFRAQVALKWSTQDFESILKAHDLLDKSLQTENIGRLVYRAEKLQLPQLIEEQALDGFHQMGSLRMATHPDEGVTDAYGRMYGVPNLYIASSAIFPTSGQANPTLSLIALTLRQAKKIKLSLAHDENTDA